jgi:hypothetical protein
MCTLANDIDAFGTRVSDPLVVNWIATRLAGTGLTIAEIVRSLSGKLDWALIDPDHWLEVAEAFDKATRASGEACSATQAAAEALRNHTQLPR